MAVMATTKADDTLLDWLRDAHAIEEQAVKMLTNTASRLENYPKLRARMEQHAAQSRTQADLVRSCIERRGSSTSGMKDVAGKLMGIGQAMSGLFTSDELMKAVLASAAFEQLEVSSYRSLIAAAEQVGDEETKRVCERILHEEEEMRDWLDSQVPGLTRAFLARDERGQTAKH